MFLVYVVALVVVELGGIQVRHRWTRLGVRSEASQQGLSCICYLLLCWRRTSEDTPGPRPLPPQRNTQPPASRSTFIICCPPYSMSTSSCLLSRLLVSVLVDTPLTEKNRNKSRPLACVKSARPTPVVRNSTAE